MSIKEKIRTLFEKEKELTAKELIFKTTASKQMVHLVLKSLVEVNFIEKYGKPPKSIYKLLEDADGKSKTNLPELSIDKSTLLENNFVAITDKGDLITGLEAFAQWCEKRNQPLLKTIDEFIKTKEKYKPYYNSNGLINGSTKLENTYKNNTYLNAIYYLDFYAIERFGKTRLGTLLHFAKQGQNLFLMNKMMSEIRENIISFINSNKFDAVGFVPPTIRREVQIMKFIKENLRIALPILDIKKTSGIIPIPQKSLSKLDDRIINADNTFAITEQRTFNKILLIDDAVGSGATLNQIAKKIKIKKVADEVVGLAIVGSFKGFDVITDI